MEDVMRFETSLAHENAFRIVEERIKTAIRSYGGKSYRLRDAPHWTHRTVTKTRDEDYFRIRVDGAFEVHRRTKWVKFQCDMTVVLEKKGDKLLFVEVIGGVRPVGDGH